MKEYIALDGGRYTYAEDILNLQELSLSMLTIFDACSNFIISGCEFSGTEITPGYVWINGKVRRFEGCNDAVSPYYIFEKNSNDSVTYANDVNKRGRCNYLCVGGSLVPNQPDAVTKAVPQFIEMKPDYSPRFIDKFFGKYAILSDSPFPRQTIKKELILTGKLTGDRDLESKTGVSVVNSTNGYSLKNIVKANGNGSLGAYLNGLLINEIVINTDGSFSFLKQGRELARVSEDGFTYTHSVATTSQIGAIRLYDSHLVNTDDNTDEGTVNINYTGYEKGGTKFRNFNVYNGKLASVPIFQVIGKTATVNIHGQLTVNNPGKGFVLSNTSYLKGDVKLTNTLSWTDSANDAIAHIGYLVDNAYSFHIQNSLGDIVIATKGYLDVQGELRINGTGIGSIYVTQLNFTTELKKKVNTIDGKQLSTEDFSTEYKKKLDSIAKGNLTTPTDGYLTTKEALEALSKKLTASENLADIVDKSLARFNLGVYSKGEANSTFLKISYNLLELISLTSEEINGLSPEQATELKSKKQAAVRDNLDAEKKGIGELKLAKASNLSDLPDKAQARKNISVYSTTEIDKILEGKLSTDAAYTGAVFTTDLKKKLEDIKTGCFVGLDNEGKPINQTEGYVLVSHIVKELTTKANLLLDGYNTSQKDTIAVNIDFYRKAQADLKFASVDSVFQDYITHLVKGGKTTVEAQQIIRDKLNTPSKEDVSNNYLRKDGKLSDLTLVNADAKKLVCRTLGAAYAEEYQPKLIDTGWIEMSNSGSATDTRQLFIRQIGNIVCIQGIINTAKRDGGNWGGVVASVPNSIPPPKHGLRASFADYNDDHKYNRGASFKMFANSRNIHIYESGWYNADTEINFTYMT